MDDIDFCKIGFTSVNVNQQVVFTTIVLRKILRPDPINRCRVIEKSIIGFFLYSYNYNFFQEITIINNILLLYKIEVA
jgi:hypothetical protein